MGTRPRNCKSNSGSRTVKISPLMQCALGKDPVSGDQTQKLQIKLTRTVIMLSLMQCVSGWIQIYSQGIPDREIASPTQVPELCQFYPLILRLAGNELEKKSLDRGSETPMVPLRPPLQATVGYSTRGACCQLKDS